jgi:hypothetical protein
MRRYCEDKILVFAVISTVLLLVPCAFAKHAGPDSQALTRFRDAMTREGFDVSLGATHALNAPVEWCAGKIDSALYANNEPYFQVVVPPQLVKNFRLRQDEAIVLIGLTPPPVKYFSYTPYLSTRVYPDGRRSIFASLGASSITPLSNPSEGVHLTALWR